MSFKARSRFKDVLLKIKSRISVFGLYKGHPKRNHFVVPSNNNIFYSGLHYDTTEADKNLHGLVFMHSSSMELLYSKCYHHIALTFHL